MKFENIKCFEIDRIIDKTFYATADEKDIYYFLVARISTPWAEKEIRQTEQHTANFV